MSAPASQMPPTTLIDLTPTAREHVLRLMSREKKEGSGLRVSVVGGGCSGMSYKMSFESAAAAADNVMEFDGLKVFIDPKSALFLKGIQIDYVDGLNGAGFTYQNPNAKKSCGCGTSFSA